MVGSLDGNLYGWCVDTDQNIYKGHSYDAMVFSSYGGHASEEWSSTQRTWTL